MRTTIITSVVSGLIALSLAACSGANVEPVDQSAQAEQAKLAAPPGADGPDGKHDGKGRGHRDPAEMVKKLDKNGDGALQVSELPEKMKEHMAKADTNADGVISVEELKAGHDKMRAEHLAKVDTDHDGKVSDAERKAAFEKFAQERFAKEDKNSDGSLTKDEIGDKKWEHLSVADADKSGGVTQAEIQAAVAAGTLKFPHHGRGGHGGRHGGPGPDGAGPDRDAPPAPAAPSGT